MADDIREVCEITKISKALVINMGTLNERTVASMIAAGKQVNALEIPVIFDPVGAGASAFRNETAQKILEEVKLSVIRENLSEVSYLAGLGANTSRVRGCQIFCNRQEELAVCQYPERSIGTFLNL